MMSYGFMGFGMLLFIGFWVLIILGIVWLVMTLTRNAHTKPAPAAPPPAALPPPAPAQTPLDILKMRYAKGEITQEQFLQMKQDLGA